MMIKWRWRMQHTFNAAIPQRIGWRTKIISSSFLILRCRLWTGEFPPARTSWTRSRNRKTGKNLSGPAQVPASHTRENSIHPRLTSSSPPHPPIIKSLRNPKTREVKWPRLRLRFFSRMTDPTPASCTGPSRPPSPPSWKGPGTDSRITRRASAPPRLWGAWANSGRRSLSTRQWIILGKRYVFLKIICHHLKADTPIWDVVRDMSWNDTKGWNGSVLTWHPKLAGLVEVWCMAATVIVKAQIQIFSENNILKRNVISYGNLWVAGIHRLL